MSIKTNCTNSFLKKKMTKWMNSIWVCNNFFLKHRLCIVFALIFIHEWPCFAWEQSAGSFVSVYFGCVFDTFPLKVAKKKKFCKFGEALVTIYFWQSWQSLNNKWSIKTFVSLVIQFSSVFSVSVMNDPDDVSSNQT